MNRLFVIAILSAAFALSACRPTGDDLLSYGQPDNQAFTQAELSYSEQFKALWTAMNENYCIWDFEESFGIKWDEVYRTYLPRFQELDSLPNGATDAQLHSLYRAFIDSLHDGHMSVQIKNIKTGRYVSISPNYNRIMRERGEIYQEAIRNNTDLDAYLTSSVLPKYQIKTCDMTDSRYIMIDIIDSTMARAIRAADRYIALVQADGGPNPTNDSVFAFVQRMKADATTFLAEFGTDDQTKQAQLSSLTAVYNRFCTTYALLGKMLGVTMVPLESKLEDDLLTFARYALFDGNIAYLRVGNCGLTAHLEPQMYSSDSASVYFAYQQAVQRVWHHWFDTIQALHATSQLGGIILDMRNNRGGYVNDYKFLLGALLPSGGWQSHTLRVKNGIGRLDFGPLVPFVVPTYPDDHAVISEQPIVVLANVASVSMAENTTWGVLSQPNGYFIGTRTYGGLSALNTDPAYYSDTYSGAFGVRQVTPIYGYIPKYVCLYPQSDGTLLPQEGVGFSPNLELRIDTTLWQTQHRDNQLEAAIDYIRSH